MSQKNPVPFEIRDTSPRLGGLANRTADDWRDYLQSLTAAVNGPMPRPSTTLKLALSSDGKIGKKHQRVRLTGFEADQEVHRQRAQHDAILVGIGTVIADNPILTVRHHPTVRQPIRCVLDPNLDFPKQCNLAQTVGEGAVIIFAKNAYDRDSIVRRQYIQARGVYIISIDEYNYDNILCILSVLGVSSLMVEGGYATARRFLNECKIDSIITYNTNKIIGINGVPNPMIDAKIKFNFRQISQRNFGDDLEIMYVNNNINEKSI